MKGIAETVNSSLLKVSHTSFAEHNWIICLVHAMSHGSLIDFIFNSADGKYPDKKYALLKSTKLIHTSTQSHEYSYQPSLRRPKSDRMQDCWWVTDFPNSWSAHPQCASLRSPAEQADSKRVPADALQLLSLMKVVASTQSALNVRRNQGDQRRSLYATNASVTNTKCYFPGRINNANDAVMKKRVWGRKKLFLEMKSLCQLCSKVHRKSK